MTHPSIERFKNITDRNVLALQEAKQAGKKVVGQYCIYSPLEIALAAGAVPVSLCGTKNDSIPAAESMLPRSLCPLIKSSFGFALEDSCPYLAASDIVIADTTCDGKKKMFELLAERKPMFILQLPQIQNGYYYFVDRQAESEMQHSDAQLMERASLNFSIALYDVDTDTLYYIEVDT